MSDTVPVKKSKTDTGCSVTKTEPTDVLALNPKLNSTVLFVSDMKKSAQIFKELFGYTDDLDSPYLIKVKSPHGDGCDIAVRKENDSGSKFYLMFTVNDLDKFHEIASKRTDLKTIRNPERNECCFFAEYRTEDGVQFTIVDEASSEPQPPPKVTGRGISHIDIPVGDNERAKKFYSEAFGWTFVEYGHYTIFNTNDKKYPITGGFYRDDMNRGLNNRGKRFEVPAIHIYVTDMKEACEKVKAAGGSIAVDTFPLGTFGLNTYIKDSEGNILGLYQDV